MCPQSAESLRYEEVRFRLVGWYQLYLYYYNKE